MIRRALAVLFLALAPLPAAGESCHWALGVTGVTIDDLEEIDLYDEATTPASVLPDPGITLTALENGDYELGGLPDAEPGTGERYRVNVTYLGARFSCGWPVVAQSLQPQAVSHPVGFTPSAARLELAAGDLLPFAEARVSGLTADPTGATVTFTLADSTGEAVIDAEAAELADAASYSGFDQNGNPVTLWRALLRYRWQAGDTDSAGDYTYSFRITFPGSPPRPLTIPPPRSWPARIHP